MDEPDITPSSGLFEEGRRELGPGEQGEGGRGPLPFAEDGRHEPFDVPENICSDGFPAPFALAEDRVGSDLVCRVPPGKKLAGIPEVEGLQPELARPAAIELIKAIQGDTSKYDTWG